MAGFSGEGLAGAIGCDEREDSEEKDAPGTTGAVEVDVAASSALLPDAGAAEFTLGTGIDGNSVEREESFSEMLETSAGWLETVLAVSPVCGRGQSKNSAAKTIYHLSRREFCEELPLATALTILTASARGTGPLGTFLRTTGRRDGSSGQWDSRTSEV